MKTNQSALKLDFAQSTLLGVACNAPIYSIAVTTALLVAAIGRQAPLALIFCGFISFGVLIAYMRLNREEVNAGAAYTWVSRIIGPTAGFFAGWSLLLASLISMISVILPAGKATLLLLSPEMAESKAAVTLCAILWLIAVTAVVMRRVKIVGNLQSVLTFLELGLIVAMCGAIAWMFMASPVSPPPASVFSPRDLDAKFFTEGVVLAVFFYWGWDVIFNLSEETNDSQTTSAQAGIVALLLLILFFTFFAYSALVLDEKEMKQAGDNVVIALAGKVFPPPFHYLASLAFLLSTTGALVASILQFSRTIFAMSRDGLVSARFAHLHQRWRTPVLAIALDSSLVLLLVAGTYFSQTVEETILAGVAASGIFVAYYYGLTGIACVVHFLRKPQGGAANWLLYVVWPGCSVMVLFTAAVLSTSQFGALTAATIVSGVLLGAALLLLRKKKPGPSARQ